MKRKQKAQPFETVFSNNFKPSLFEQFVQRFEVNRTELITRLLPGGKVLVDIACGDGKLLFAAAPKYSKCIGFDIAKNRILQAQTKSKRLDHSSKFQFTCADLDTGIPLKDNTVDLVVCEASLSYFLRPEETLSEMYRILKPGGSCIIQIGNYAFLTRRLALLLGVLPKISSFSGFGDGGMLHYFTYKVLKDLLSVTGFTISLVTNSGLAAPFRQIWPELLASDIIIMAKKPLRTNKKRS